MNFGDALAALKSGKRVARAGWNGSKRPVFFQPPSREPHVAFGLVWVRLNDGEVAVCDAADYDLIAPHTWSNIKGYPSFTDNVSIPRHTVKMHAVLNPSWEMADHINGDPLDNRRENLRQCSAQQNAANSRSHDGTTSVYKGVSWDSSRDKWISSIQTAGRTKHVGRFDDEMEAARAYDSHALALHGEFARLNFPPARMWLWLIVPSQGDCVASELPPGVTYNEWRSTLALPWIGMKTADDCFVPWLASQTDMLAEDWTEVT